MTIIKSKTVKRTTWRNGLNGVGSGYDVDILEGDAGERAMLVSTPDRSLMVYSDLSDLDRETALSVGQNHANGGDIPDADESDADAEAVFNELDSLPETED